MGVIYISIAEDWRVKEGLVILGWLGSKEKRRD